jgi:DNA-binding transcriptional MerR regulator
VDGISWSIAQVARLSGTTSRTLRHYDAIGLLPPSHVGANGYRYYRQADLLRLQQILLLRQLGLGLDAVEAILAGQQDRVTALRQHRQWLLAERDRFDRLADTVARTIEELEGGEEMSAKEMFEGFEANPYRDEAVERWGEDAVVASEQRIKGWTPEQAEQAQRGWFDALARVAEHHRAGTAPDDPAVLDAVAVHHAWLGNFWEPNAESYTGLGRMYTDDPRFRDQIDRDDPGLAQYLSEAMAAYATARLS